MSASSSLEIMIDAVLAGSAPLPDELLLHALPGDNAHSGGAIATLFWAKWRRQSGLHDQLLAALDPLAQALTLLPAAQWIAAPQHPVWQLLELLQSSGAGYQPELGRAGEKLLADLASIFNHLKTGDWSGATAFASSQWRQEQSRLQRLEQRLIDGERGLLRNRRAQQQAARVLNRAIAGKHLPAAMAVYLQDVWYRELQWSLLHFGEDSAAWQRRTKLTMRLIESLQDPGDDLERRQHLYALIPEIGGELRAVLGEHTPDADALERQLALIEKHHLALLKGQPLPAAPCALITNNDPWSDAATTISRDLLQQVTALELGNWFLLRDSNEESRIKLVLKMDDTAQLLFVNRLGVKALQKSFEEFAYLLALGNVAALPPPTIARLVVRQLLSQLLQRGAQQQRAQIETQQREESEALRRRETKEKAIAEAKALAEAQAQAVAQAQAGAFQRSRDQEQLRRRTLLEGHTDNAEQRLRYTRQSATLLPVGSWVELHDEIGSAQRLKLAVVLPSSGKLIFVDREGVRRAEFARDTFVARLLEGSARLLDEGPQFEDTLARVVDSLRRDRAARE
ncbi:MAG TPA: DUF1631 family protein [Spongiibacteraceae bacterium]